MVTNVAKMGFRCVPMDEDLVVIKKEQKHMKSWIKRANAEESLMAVQAKVVKDYEHYGFGFYEVIRNKTKTPTLLKYAPALLTRVLPKSEKSFPVKYIINRGGTRATVVERKKFRRYVQQIGAERIFFKEFGEPRVMDWRTGKYEDEIDGRVPVEYQATEILHRRQHSEDAYGLPRWISQLPAILGSRESEEVNLHYFEDNTIPPAILSVAGGRLTRKSYELLQNILQEQGLGKDRQHKIILVEAIPEVSGLDERGNTVKIQIDKLNDVRPQDGLFQEYDQGNIRKIRSSFRLPPSLIGATEDVNFASSQIAIYVAETQTFAPERMSHDEFLNMNFFNHSSGLGFTTVRIESMGPKITNPDAILKALTALNVMGGVTPRSAIDMANETMQLSLPQYPEKGSEDWEEWMDLPMNLGLKRHAQEAKSAEKLPRDNENQGSKDADTKETEGTGKTGPRTPEHGKEDSPDTPEFDRETKPAK